MVVLASLLTPSYFLVDEDGEAERRLEGMFSGGIEEDGLKVGSSCFTDMVRMEEESKKESEEKDKEKRYSPVKWMRKKVNRELCIYGKKGELYTKGVMQ